MKLKKAFLSSVRSVSFMKRILAICSLALFCSIAEVGEPSLRAQVLDPPYGGLCCQIRDINCGHPIGWIFIDAKWTDGLSFCP